MDLPELQVAKTLPDAWDYKGQPVHHETTGGWVSAAMILGVEACERLATLGIAVNLVTYLTGTMHFGNASSCYQFLGYLFYVMPSWRFCRGHFSWPGVTILAISTAIPSLQPPKCTPNGCVSANMTQVSFLYIALYMTALGTGGLKSSVGFGSDQFDETDKEEKTQMATFFNWFFFFISIGSLGAVTVLVCIQDHVGRPWGMGSLLVLLLSGG